MAKQWQFVPGPMQLMAPILAVVPRFLQGSAPLHEPAPIVPADSPQGESPDDRPIQLPAPMVARAPIQALSPRQAPAPIAAAAACWQAFSPRQELAPIEAAGICWQAFPPTQESAPMRPFEKSQAFTPMQLFAPMVAVEQKQESSTPQALTPIVATPTLLHTRTSVLSALDGDKLGEELGPPLGLAEGM